jgi:hypothetical protein
MVSSVLFPVLLTLLGAAGSTPPRPCLMEIQGTLKVERGAPEPLLREERYRIRLQGTLQEGEAADGRVTFTFAGTVPLPPGTLLELDSTRQEPGQSLMRFVDVHPGPPMLNLSFVAPFRGQPLRVTAQVNLSGAWKPEDGAAEAVLSRVLELFPVPAGDPATGLPAGPVVNFQGLSLWTLHQVKSGVQLRGETQFKGARGSSQVEGKATFTMGF